MNSQMQLFDRNSVSSVVEQILRRDELRDKTGAVVGHVVKLQGRKAIALELGLTKRADKDTLDERILSRRDMMMTTVKGTIASLGADWTFTKVQSRDLASGIRQLTVVAQQIARRSGPSDEAIAKALGKPVEWVKAEREAREAREARADVDVQSSRVESPQLAFPVIQPDGSAPETVDVGDSEAVGQ